MLFLDILLSDSQTKIKIVILKNILFLVPVLKKNLAQLQVDEADVDNFSFWRCRRKRTKLESLIFSNLAVQFFS